MVRESRGFFSRLRASSFQWSFQWSLIPPPPHPVSEVLSSYWSHKSFSLNSQAALFSFQLQTPGAQCTDSASGPSASLGLDSHDITALDALRIHFTVRWPLPLTLSQSALGKMEQACRGWGGGSERVVIGLVLEVRKSDRCTELGSARGEWRCKEGVVVGGAKVWIARVAR